MEHESTFIILLFFEKSRPKVRKTVELIEQLSTQASIGDKYKLGLILDRIEQIEMNEFTFLKIPPRQTLQQVDYHRGLFNFMNFDRYEIETRTRITETAYLHGSVIFKKKHGQLSLFNITKAA
jgi:hypothetical protein